MEEALALGTVQFDPPPFWSEQPHTAAWQRGFVHDNCLVCICQAGLGALSREAVYYGFTALHAAIRDARRVCPFSPISPTVLTVCMPCVPVHANIAIWLQGHHIPGQDRSIPWPVPTPTCLSGPQGLDFKLDIPHTALSFPRICLARR